VFSFQAVQSTWLTFDVKTFQTHLADNQGFSTFFMIPCWPKGYIKWDLNSDKR